MKYKLMIRARPQAEEAIPAKHDRLMEQLRTLEPPWGLTVKRWTPAKDAGSQFSSSVSLAGMLGSGIKGRTSYANRAHLPDAARADDWVCLEFNPAKVDYGTLVNRVFPSLICAFGAYVGNIEDVQVSNHDFDAWQASGIDDRHGVFRLYPVHFFDQLLCRRAFSLTPKQIVKRLQGHVEQVGILNDGVLIVASSKVLSFEDTLAVDDRLRPLLMDTSRPKHVPGSERQEAEDEAPADNETVPESVIEVQTDKYVLPLIPEQLNIDPLLAALLHVAAFLEHSGEDTVDPDWALEAMETMGYYLQRLPARRAKELQRQLDALAKYTRKHDWDSNAVSFVPAFLQQAGIGEEGEN